MLRVYNTLTRKKEGFRPQKKNYVRFFVCGPTVYDLSHIGHARTYIAFDVIAKYLQYSGYEVFYLQNITDVDDKIIKRAQKLGSDPLKLARLEEQDYQKDVTALKIESVTQYARASEYIPQIIDQVQRLIKKGHAYAGEGNVYFDIATFPEYGKLSHQKLSKLRKAVRIEADPHKKHDFDFALWKAQKPGEPSWESPWSPGRPGWHIEDTAISEKIFGPQYDVHGGGGDLIFPHHESEIAQMEAVSGKKPFVRYWLHTGGLTVKGEKMSKSLGNFITIRNFLSKYSPEVLRFLVLSHHYRSPIDYNEKMAQQARESLERLNEFINKLLGIKRPKDKNKKRDTEVWLTETKKKFTAYMNDDFNTPKAFAVLFDFVRKINRSIDRQELTQKEARGILDFFDIVGGIFGIFEREKRGEEKIPEKIQRLVALRERYRKEKNWIKADKVRYLLSLEGYWVEDTPAGPRVKQRAIGE